MGFWEVKIDLKPILSGILSQCQHIRPHESMIGTTFILNFLVAGEIYCKREFDH